MGKRKDAGKDAGKDALAAEAVDGFKRMTEARRKRQRAQWKEVAGPVLETPERRRHAASVVDHPATADDSGLPGSRLCRRVLTPLHRLLARGSISDRMYTAGTLLRNHHEAAVHLTPSSDVARRLPIRGRGGSGGLEPSERQVSAYGAYREALRCLGPHVGAVVVAVCCHERDVSVVAEQQCRNRDKVMGVLEDGLKTLADHYGLIGSDE